MGFGYCVSPVDGEDQKCSHRVGLVGIMFADDVHNGFYIMFLSDVASWNGSRRCPKLDVDYTIGLEIGQDAPCRIAAGESGTIISCNNSRHAMHWAPCSRDILNTGQIVTQMVNVRREEWEESGVKG